MRYSIAIKTGPTTERVVDGRINLAPKVITVADLEKIPEIEAFLERLTGFRFHINEVPDRKK